MSTETSTRPEANPWSADLTPQQKAFLDAFAEKGSVIASCQGICHRLSHFHWLDESDAYRQAFRIAKAMFGEHLRDIALSRAVEGTEEPVFYKGRLQRDEKGAVVTRRKFWPALLKMFIQWMTKPWSDEIVRRSASNPTLRNTLEHLICERDLAAHPLQTKKPQSSTSWKKVRQAMRNAAQPAF